MRCLIVILLCFFSLTLHAQDWIVITSGDSIKCKIWAVDDGQIVYQTPDETRPQILPIELVADYLIYVPKTYPEFKPDPLSDLQPNDIKKESSNKGLRIGLMAGYTYMLAPISKDTPTKLKSYAKKSKSGYHMNVDLSYFFGKYFGLGIDYSHVGLKGHSETFGGYFSGYRYEHDIKIDYWGIRPMARLASKDNAIRFLPGIGIGYVNYITKVANGYNSTKNLRAGTFGIEVHLNLELRIAKGFYTAFAVNLMTALVTSDSYFGSDRGDPNNLTRLDASCGIRYYIR